MKVATGRNGCHPPVLVWEWTREAERAVDHRMTGFNVDILGDDASCRARSKARSYLEHRKVGIATTRVGHEWSDRVMQQTSS